MKTSTTNPNPRKKLRIAIEAQRIFRPQKHGMDVVALEMIRQLQLIDTYNEYFILTKKDEDICLTETSNFHIVYIEGRSYPDWEQLSLAKWVRINKPDILHCTSNTAPLKIRCPLFLTLHDLIFLEKNYLLSRSGGSPYQRFGNFYRSLVAPRVARRAKLVFTVSSYQKEQIKQKLHLPDEKVKVIYNGVSPQFFEQAKPEIKDVVRQTYNLPNRYIFFLGNTEPRKNLLGVLAAYAILLKKKGDDAPTLVIKGISEKYLSKMLSSLELSDVATQITLVGYIKSEHFHVVYQMAEMLLFPSYSEGFGIPIIEAMASRIPVITSNVTSMPEVAGGAALLVAPSSPQNIEDAMELLLSNSELRDTLVQKGYEHSRGFTWQKVAEEVLNSYLSFKFEQK